MLPNGTDVGESMSLCLLRGKLAPVDIHVKHPTSGNTPLHVAVAKHSHLVVKELVQLGAQLHSVNAQSQTALFQATLQACLGPERNMLAEECVVALVAGGAVIRSCS